MNSLPVSPRPSSSTISFGNVVVIGTTTTRPSLKALCCDLGDDALHGGSDLQQVQRTLLDGRRRGHHLHGLVSYANLIHRQRRQVFEQSLKAMHGQTVTGPLQCVLAVGLGISLRQSDKSLHAV